MVSIARNPPVPAPGDAAELRERARGALLGLAVGDALGAPAENLRPSEIRARWGRITGYVTDRPSGTDDTEYAIFSGLLLARHGSALTPAHVEAAWHEWIADRAEGPFRGAGFSERGTLENLRRGLAAPISAQHRHAWSDGLAMRAAPFGVFAAGRPGEAARLVAVDGSISHEGEGIYGGQAVAAGVAAAMAGAPVTVVIASALAVVPDDSWTARSLRRAVTVAHRGERAVRSAVVIGGYPWTDLAPEAVALAFGAYAAADGDFREAVLTAVNMGRDADTTAAVAGALAGATQGLAAIPPDWASAIGPARGRCLPSMAGHHVLDVAELLVPGEGGKWGADVVLPEVLPERLRGLLRGPAPDPVPDTSQPVHEVRQVLPQSLGREPAREAAPATGSTPAPHTTDSPPRPAAVSAAADDAPQPAAASAAAPASLLSASRPATAPASLPTAPEPAGPPPHTPAEGPAGQPPVLVPATGPCERPSPPAPTPPPTERPPARPTTSASAERPPALPPAEEPAGQPPVLVPATGPRERPSPPAPTPPPTERPPARPTTSASAERPPALPPAEQPIPLPTTPRPSGHFPPPAPAAEAAERPGALPLAPRPTGPSASGPTDPPAPRATSPHPADATPPPASAPAGQPPPLPARPGAGGPGAGEQSPLVGAGNGGSQDSEGRS
ncbi:ADP-ribosylglycohydrolase [Streptomyces sp. 1222.5]|uniref:ADP-ribosylglycohydrolase family protein n=1 Tax=unclassified Streptomyces TaxID=2593676 RepID=UPI000896DDA2|nr:MULTISPECIES: ADP-ribosylglycohydrolase family protein [unclassified Streptomyces]PKW07191.1 ADP-ribosylglycohydrolase [Streptomyces sp. 5112.2]SEC95495.1 ADP-ribosylglycohydrolase [Streptomyces sp. 1222.5]